jgi:hypothetical protein
MPKILKTGPKNIIFFLKPGYPGYPDPVPVIENPITGTGFTPLQIFQNTHIFLGRKKNCKDLGVS